MLKSIKECRKGILFFACKAIDKKNKTTYLLILLLLGITLGYAYLNTTLNINGTTNITSASWNIYWDNIVFGTNNVTDITTPATISSRLTEVTYNGTGYSNCNIAFVG